MAISDSLSEDFSQTLNHTRDETLTPKERSDRRKKALKIAAVGAGIGGAGWAVDESARAVMERTKRPTSMFSLKTYAQAKAEPKVYGKFVAARALGTGLKGASIAPLAYGAYNAVKPQRKITRFDTRRDLVDPAIGTITGRNPAAMMSTLVDRNPPGVAKKPETAVVKYVELAPGEEKELARRKRAARGLAYTTGTTGLTALALTTPQGAKMLGRSKRPILRRLGQSKIARRLASYEPSTTPASQFLATAGAGIGGVGSFNFARMQGLEAKREQGGVVKSDDKGRNAAVGGGVGELKKGFDPLDGARAFKKPLRGPRGRVVQRVKARPDHGDDWSAAHRVDPRGPQRSAKALIAINPAKSEGAGWEEVMRHEMIHAGVRKPRSAIARQSANPYKDGGEEARAHALSGSWRNMGDMSDRPKEFRRGFDDVMGILESKGLRKSIDYQRVSPGAEDAHRNLSSGRRQQAMGSVISGLGAAAAGSVAADTYLNRGTMSRPGKVSGALAAATVPFATLSMIQNAQDARSLDKKVKRIERKAAERESAGVYGRDRGLFPYQERSGRIVEKAGFTAKPGFTTVVQTNKGKLYRLSRQAPLGFKPAAGFAVDSKGTVKETAERAGRLRDLDRPETSLTSTPRYSQQSPRSAKHQASMVTRSNPVVKRDVSKASPDSDPYMGALIGTGAVGVAAGLYGGGIPGVRANTSGMKNLSSASPVRRVRTLAATNRGGVFGARTDYHARATSEFEADRDHWKKKGPAMDARDMFMRGREAGKIAPEKDIIRHLKIGRAGSNALLVGGAGLIGAGVYRADQRKKVKKFDQDAYFGGLLAGGGSLALLSAGGKATLKNQSRRWKRRELNSLEMARRSSPNVAPRKTSNAVYGNKSGWKSVTPSQAYAAGLHRGDATQAKYFSMEYRNLARLADKGTKAGIIAGAIGGGALAAGGVKRHLEKGLRPLSIRPRRVTMRAGGLVSRNGKQFTRRGSLG